jgi:hypothetical protein
MGGWEREEEEQRRQNEVFRRIHRLYKRGFRPHWTVTVVEDALWWKHPGGHPDLILFSSGMLVASMQRAVLAPNSRHDNDRIFNQSKADEALFDRWIASVKPPTWWQAGATARERYIWMPVVFVVVNGLMLLTVLEIEKAVKAAWHGVFQ